MAGVKGMRSGWRRDHPTNPHVKGSQRQPLRMCKRHRIMKVRISGQAACRMCRTEAMKRWRAANPQNKLKRSKHVS